MLRSKYAPIKVAQPEIHNIVFHRHDTRNFLESLFGLIER